MSISISTSFDLTASQIVEEAFARLGIGQEGEALTPRMERDGMRALNLLIKTWGADEHLWTETEGTLAMVSGQAAYDISPKPMRVLFVRRRTQGIDTPLGMFSRQEYFDQPNKTQSPSIPVNFYYDPQQATGTLYLWPAPSDQAVSTVTINYTYLRKMADMDVNTNNLDMPQEWLEAVIYALAVRLMAQYPVNDPKQAQLVIGVATSLYDALTAWDNEPASIQIQPNYESWPRC